MLRKTCVSLTKVMTGSRAFYKLQSLDGTELTGCWHRPVGVTRGDSNPAVLLAHPHPLYGGAMTNPLILHMCDVANLSNLVAFRFNFRGVHPSLGETSEDFAAEREDAIAVARETQKFYSKVVLVGYSFGAMIFASVLEELKDVAVGFVAISYPIAVMPSLTPDYKMFADTAIAGVKAVSPNALFVHGSKDNLATPEKVPEFFEAAGITPSVISGADHFWGEQEAVDDLTSVVGPWIAERCGTKFSPDLSLLGFRE